MIDWDKTIEYFFAAMTSASASFAAISLGIGLFEARLSGIIVSGTFILILLLLSTARSLK